VSGKTELGVVAETIRMAYEQLSGLHNELKRAEADLRIAEQETDRRSARCQEVRRRYDDAADLLREMWSYYRKTKEHEPRDGPVMSAPDA
jgi:chromosome segregation ATPase